MHACMYVGFVSKSHTKYVAIFGHWQRIVLLYLRAASQQHILT